MGPICADQRRPNANLDGAQCGDDTATVSHHRGARTLFPEGVLPQRLHQEPEAARPFLQYARCVSVQGYLGTLPGRKDRKGGLLADARGPEQHRHDGRQPGLTDQEENQVVTFLQTLTDGFTTPYPDINTFTSQCMTGGSAATQGNEFLLPTPPLPPCASAICGIQPLPVPHPIP